MCQGFVKAARKVFKGMPEEAICTLTIDNGKEFASHSELAESVKCEVFFARPYHP